MAQGPARGELDAGEYLPEAGTGQTVVPTVEYARRPLVTPFRAAVAAGALAVGFVAGFLSNGTSGETTISEPGHGTITQLVLEPGLYCDAAATVQMDGVRSTYSWLPGIGPFHSPIHATVSETMDGPIDAQVCIKTAAARDAVKAKTGPFAGKYVLNLTASGDPNKSDFELLLSQSPTALRYSFGGSWEYNLDEAVTAPSRSELNLIPGVHLGDHDGIKQLLRQADVAQAYNYVSVKAGPEIVRRLTASGIPGGNMQQRMMRDMIADTPGASGAIQPSQIAYNIVIDGRNSGVPNQYSKAIAQMGHDVPGLQFPKPNQMPNVTDAVRSVGQVG